MRLPFAHLLFFLLSAPFAIASGPLHLILTFPAQGDTFSTDRVRISGATNGQAQVWVGTERVKVFPHGAFATRVDLDEGWNRIPVRTRLASQVARDTLRIYRLPAGLAIAAAPAAVDTFLMVKIRSEAQLWSEAAGGDVIGLLAADVPLRVIGRTGSRYQVALGFDRLGYADTADVIVQSSAAAPLPAAISAPMVSRDREWLRLSFQIERPVPALVDPPRAPGELTMTLYDAVPGPSWKVSGRSDGGEGELFWPQLENGYDPDSVGVTWIFASQPGPGKVLLQVRLAQMQIWGYRIEYSSKMLHLLIRRPPALHADKSRPLQGLRILVDPGHGGEEKGAVSPTGVWEKDVNLEIGFELARMLRDQGAVVAMSRTTDTPLTTRARRDLARQHDAHLLISVHQNAAPAHAHPLRARGVSTYYALPQNKELAQAVYSRLLLLDLKPFGRRYGSFYLTRMTDALVVMVEGAFMSHPADEQKLMNKNFRIGLARAIAAGLIDFSANQP